PGSRTSGTKHARSGDRTPSRRKKTRRTIASRTPIVEQLEDRNLLSAGMLDTTFGTNGFDTLDFGVKNGSNPPVGDVRVTGISVLPGGKTLVVGTSTLVVGTSTSYRFTLARYTSDGKLDTSFGSGGTATEVPPYPDGVFGPLTTTAFAIEPDRGTLVKGNLGGAFTSFTSSRTTVALARFQSDCLLPVNYLSQGWEPWGNQILGDPTQSSVTIGNKGCALTTLAMLLNHALVPTDPLTLNTLLVDNNGYANGNDIQFQVDAQIALNDASKRNPAYKNLKFFAPRTSSVDALQQIVCLLHVPVTVRVHAHNTKEKPDKDWDHSVVV